MILGIQEIKYQLPAASSEKATPHRVVFLRDIQDGWEDSMREELK